MSSVAVPQDALELCARALFEHRNPLGEDRKMAHGVWRVFHWTDLSPAQRKEWVEDVRAVFDAVEMRGGNLRSGVQLRSTWISRSEIDGSLRIYSRVSP